MPWKTHPALGYLKGFITRGSETNTIDGASITLSGPASKTLTSDATGFYGAANIPPGTYTLVSESTTNTCIVAAGKVTTINLSVP